MPWGFFKPNPHKIIMVMVMVMVRDLGSSSPLLTDT
jgi:hypothetical protein